MEVSFLHFVTLWGEGREGNMRVGESMGKVTKLLSEGKTVMLETSVWD